MNEYIKAALIESKKAYEKLEVPVGAVIVKEGKIIAKAHNLREKNQDSTSHAELLCIKKACKKLKSWRLDDLEMYVTLEPCAMCAGAIIQARIGKVIFGAKDYKNGAVGSVLNVLDSDVTWKTEYEYMENSECSHILTDFFKMLRESKKSTV